MIRGTDQPPRGARFAIELRDGRAHLRATTAIALPDGALETLELVAPDLPRRLDLRDGAISLQNRRTHANALGAHIPARAFEGAASRAGLFARVSPLPNEDQGSFFALDIWDQLGALSAVVHAHLRDGALHVHLRDARSLQGATTDRVIDATRRILEELDPSAQLVAEPGPDADARSVAHAILPRLLERLVSRALLPLGWRPTDCGALNGTLKLSLLGGSPGFALEARRDLPAFVDSPGAPTALPALVELEESTSRETLDAAIADEPSAWLRADRLLAAVERGLLAPERSTVEALAHAGRIPAAVSRAIAIAESHDSDRIVEAVLTCPGAEATRAQLCLEASARAAGDGQVDRARRWLQLARPVAGDIPSLRHAEASLAEAEGAPPRERAIRHEAAARACVEAGDPDRARPHFAHAGRAFDDAGEMANADRMWTALSGLGADHLEPDAVVRAAQGLVRLDETTGPKRASRLLATLLERDPRERNLAASLHTAALLLRETIGEGGAADLFDAKKRAMETNSDGA